MGSPLSQGVYKIGNNLLTPTMYQVLRRILEAFRSSRVSAVTTPSDTYYKIKMCFYSRSFRKRVRGVETEPSAAHTTFSSLQIFCKQRHARCFSLPGRSVDYLYQALQIGLLDLIARHSSPTLSMHSDTYASYIRGSLQSIMQRFGFRLRIGIVRRCEVRKGVNT